MEGNGAGLGRVHVSTIADFNLLVTDSWDVSSLAVKLIETVDRLSCKLGS